MAECWVLHSVGATDDKTVDWTVYTLAEMKVGVKAGPMVDMMDSMSAVLMVVEKVQ